VITRVEAYRYRCFDQMGLDLGNYNVLAGPNGSGKTTLLDIPVLIGDLLRDRVCSTAFLRAQPSRGNTPRAHTLTELIHQERGDEFTLVLEVRLPAHVVRALLESSSERLQHDLERQPSHLRYELRLQVFNQVELVVLNEYLFLYPENQAPRNETSLQGEPISYGSTARSKRKLRHPDWRSVIHRERGEPSEFTPEIRGGRSLAFNVPRSQVAFASLPFDYVQFPAATWFQEFLSQNIVFLEPDWRELRRASPPGQPNDLVPSGQNLVWLALELQKNTERFGWWVDHVRTALPTVVSIKILERQEDHHAYLEVLYEGGYSVTSSGLSDGTLRILAYTLIPYLLKPPAVLVLEEPENGIHPRGIESVLQSLNSVYDSQVWLSTHSPLVLAQTELSQVICTSMNNSGAVQVIPGNKHPRLQAWQGSVDLGTLFAAGVLE
jgi:energy-coupling factor transporter ATP-binding protein EcfA2